MTATFTVSTETTGRRRSVDVLIHDDVDDLRRVAAEMSESSLEHWNEKYGACHSWAGYVADDHAATIQLCKGFVGTGIITHEITHAAMSIYAMDVLKPHSRALTHFRTDNEIIAYLVGDLCRQVVDQMYELDLFSSSAASDTN